MKKSLVFVTAAVILATVAVFAAAASDGDPDSGSHWPCSKVDNHNTSTVDVPGTPVSEADTENVKTYSFTGAVAEAACFPVIADGFVYVAGPVGDGKSVLCKFTHDLEVAAQTELNPGYLEYAGSTGWLCHGDGKIFVPSGNGVVSAYDADTLERIWTSDPVAEGYYQASNPLVYDGGYLYTAVFQFRGKGIGPMYCLDAENGNLVWLLDSETYGHTDFGMYWAGPAVVGNWLLVPTEIGLVLSVDIAASASEGRCVLSDELWADGTDTKYPYIRGSVVFDSEKGNIYYVQQNGGYAGYLVSTGFDESTGKFDNSDINTYYSGNWGRRVTPLVFMDRVYVPCMETSSPRSGGIIVFDASTLNPEYEILTKSNERFESNPSWYHLTANRHYASAENGYRIQVYATSYNSPGYVAMFEAAQDSVSGELTVIYEPSGKQAEYTTSDVTVGPDGTLYFYNDSLTYFAVPGEKSEKSDSGLLLYAAVATVLAVAVAGAAVLFRRSSNRGA